MFKNLMTFKTLLWTTSVILAVCSAAFSIFGLSKLFAGAALSVIVMASTLEFAKLITVTFLHNYYKDIKRGMRLYLLSASAILMIITSLGVYGFLTNAYQLTLKSYSENQINNTFIQKNKELLNKEIVFLEKEQQELTSRLQNYDKIRIDQESALLNNNVKRNVQRNIKSTSKLTEDISKKIDLIVEKKNIINDSLMTLEKKSLDIELQNTQTELGPLIYISRITGYSMDYIVNIFVLIITLVFDPLAIALLLAANFLSKLKLNTPPPDTTSSHDKDTIYNNEDTPLIVDPPADEIKNNLDLENSEKNAILELGDLHINNEIPPIEEDNDDEVENISDTQELTLSDEDKFYELDTQKFNKHPWKVGF